jgi:hypothetical protein
VRPLEVAFAAAAVCTGAALFTLPASSSAAPAATQVHAKYVVNGSPVGSGTVVESAGQVYVPLSAVKALTNTELTWDPQTATLYAGSATTGGGAFLEDLSRQPYYESSEALCWQSSADLTPGHMHSVASVVWCRPALSAKPTMAAQHYRHDLVVLVSASGGKAPSSSNTLTLDYDLGGRYLTLRGTVGLVDTPFNKEPMELRFVGDGRTLGSAVIAPASLPSPFKVNVAHVRQLSVQVSNVSGAAPHWGSAGGHQYAPGAVLIANPQLTG